MNAAPLIHTAVTMKTWTGALRINAAALCCVAQFVLFKTARFVGRRDHSQRCIAARSFYSAAAAFIERVNSHLLCSLVGDATWAVDGQQSMWRRPALANQRCCCCVDAPGCHSTRYSSAIDFLNGTSSIVSNTNWKHSFSSSADFRHLFRKLSFFLVFMCCFYRFLLVDNCNAPAFFMYMTWH